MRVAGESKLEHSVPFILFFLYTRRGPTNLLGLLISDTVKFQIKVIISMIVLSSEVMNFIWCTLNLRCLPSFYPSNKLDCC